MVTRTPPSGVSERRLHAVVIAVAAALAVAMVGAAAWALTRPQPPGVVVPSTATRSESSQGALPATSSAGGVTTGTPSVQTGTPGGSTPPPSSHTGAASQQTWHRIAFHIGNTLYIASEDGKSKTPMHIVGVNYALSPDGRTVAAVEKGKLVVAAVGQHLLASSPSTPGLTAEASRPVWLPDSSAVLFIRASENGAPRVWSLDRASGAASEVSPGTGIAVSPNGRTIAALPTEDAAVPAITLTTAGGHSSSIKPPSGDPVAITLSNDRLFVSTLSASGSSALWSMAYDGSKKKLVVGSTLAENTSATYGEFMISPDGTKLLFAADGDDGYSRLWTVPVAGGKSTAISGLRDGYAIGWTRDGNGILYVEGNAFQGQTTSLWQSDLTGHRKRKLLEGATL